MKAKRATVPWPADREPRHYRLGNSSDWLAWFRARVGNDASCDANGGGSRPGAHRKPPDLHRGAARGFEVPYGAEASGDVPASVETFLAALPALSR